MVYDPLKRQETAPAGPGEKIFFLKRSQHLLTFIKNNVIIIIPKEKEIKKMVNTILLIAFLAILVIDFIIAVRRKKVSTFEICVRLFMIFAFCHLCSWF